MWFGKVLKEFLDVAQGEPVSSPVRIVCVALVSLAFLVGIASLFLIAFVIEGQSLLRRICFLLMGLGILAYYLQFLHTVVHRGKVDEKE